MVDWTDWLQRLGVVDDLATMGLERIDRRRFGEGMGEEEVLFFKGRGKLVAVPYSARAGITCLVGDESADLPTYDDWPTLWHGLGMDDFDMGDPDQAEAFFAQFPDADDLDGMALFIGRKLREFFTT